MANRPANAGSGRGWAPTGNTAPPLDAVAPPADAPRTVAPRADAPRAVAPRADAPRPVAGHRAARSRESRPASDRNDAVAGGVAWVPYLIVLAGAAAGMFVVWQGSQYAGRGTALVGCSLLAAGLARLILPPRWAGLLSTRRKASDVLAFAVFGTAVLAVALMLP